MAAVSGGCSECTLPFDPILRQFIDGVSDAIVTAWSAGLSIEVVDMYLRGFVKGTGMGVLARPLYHEHTR